MKPSSASQPLIFAAWFVTLLCAVVAGCTNTLKNVDFGENARTVEPVSARAAITNLAYSDDGKMIAALHQSVHPHDVRCSMVGSPPSWLRAWNVSDEWQADAGCDLGSVALGSRTFGPIRFSRDGKQILVADNGNNDEGRIAVWNTDNNQLEHRRFGWVRAVGPHAEVIVAGDDQANQTICNQHGQAINHAWPAEELHKGFPAGWRDCFSSDGRLLAILHEQTEWPKPVFIVDWQAGKTVSSFTAERSFWNLAFSEDERLIAMTGLDGPDVVVRNVQTGQLVMTLKVEADDFWDATFSSDSQLLAVSGSTEPEKKTSRQGLTVIWHVPTWKKLKTIIDRDSWATTAVKFSPNGETLACGTTNGTIRFHKSPISD